MAFICGHLLVCHAVLRKNVNQFRSHHSRCHRIRTYCVCIQFRTVSGKYLDKGSAILRRYENADDSADYRRDYEYRVRPSADFRYVRISENGHCGRGGGDSIRTDYGGTDCHEKRLSQIPAQTGLPTPHCQNLPARYSEYSYAVGVYLLHTGIESDSCNLFRPGSNRTGTLL